MIFGVAWPQVASAERYIKVQVMHPLTCPTLWPLIDPSPPICSGCEARDRRGHSDDWRRWYMGLAQVGGTLISRRLF